jgi:hypothetical protein
LSDRGDYVNEMLWSSPMDNAAIEDILEGSGEDAVLAAFVDDARHAASGPVPAPSAALASMLETGASTESHVAVAAASVAATSRSRRMPIPAILTALPFAAKAALGVGVAAAAVGGAGAAGVLPEPVNNAVTSVISTVTPIEFRGGDTAERNAPGEGISTDARDETPGVDGGAVSADARDRQNGQPQVPAGLPSQDSNGAGSDGGALPAVVPDSLPVPGSVPVPDSVPVPIPAPPVSVPVTQGPPVQTPPVSIPDVTGAPGSARSGR